MPKDGEKTATHGSDEEDECMVDDRPQMRNPLGKLPELDLKDISKRRFNFSKDYEYEKINMEHEVLNQHINILDELK